MSWRRIVIRVAKLLGLKESIVCPQCKTVVHRVPLGSRPVLFAHICGYHREVA